MSNTPVMDSPEVLGHALCRHVPDMRKGFTIQTRHGDIYVTADDAAPFAGAMERLLMRKISLIQDEQLEQNGDTSRDPIYSQKLAAQLERNLATIDENNRQILALEPVLTQKLHFSITEGARHNLLQNIRELGNQTEQATREATRANGKCLLSEKDIAQNLMMSRVGGEEFDDKYKAALQELITQQSSTKHEELSHEEKAHLVSQINALQDVAKQECDRAQKQMPGLEWLAIVMMAYEDKAIPANSVINMIRNHFNLSTPISPATSLLGKLSHRLYTGRVHDTASDAKAGD
ncbi:hypothetical protein [Candidatus Symbiopectobacterium sp. NZEC135]|uniref:hypothetical protein n=1 Tax=Candidatus Symbiopectobacterium sp. NZEC135 TaxID=2820471 RepID=UPI0022267449|nr:hypothetical protein [Candidatus Symbiopectobacterium sp. NZEC135]MCW2478858.1 hypothetical protein [Candidatus Symbiopectobacterium sp. NZEC135]